MSTLTMQTAPLVEIAAAKCRALRAGLRAALHAFAEARIRSAIPAAHLRRLECEYPLPQAHSRWPLSAEEEEEENKRPVR
jgi:hypothetical protein